MAITPSDYARKCDVTIAHTFGSAQTGFVAVLTENSLPSEIFTTALNGGGDIRICTDDGGVNQLPIEVVKFDTVASEAVIWVRMPTADTASELWLFYGKAGESQPAVDALYGRNAVWADYNLRISCDDSLGAVDSTGLRTYSDIGNVTRGVSGKFTKAYSLINAGLTTSNPNYDFSQGYSISYWANLADMPKNGLFFMRMGNNFNISRNNGSELIIRHGGNLLVLNMQPSFYEVGTMSRYEFKWNNVTGDGFILKNGQLEKTFNFSVLPTNTTTATFFYETSTVNSDWNSIEALSFKSYVSEEYSSAEYANQSNPATFWTVGTPSDTATSTGVTSTATFSVTQPTFTSSASATVPAPIANGNFTLAKPTFSATTTVTLPQPISTASFTIDKPSVTASATAALPQPSAQAEFTVNAPAVSASASATLPSFNASASFTISKPSIESSATVTLPNPTASGSFTVPGATFRASALATLPQPESNISFTLDAPTFSATGEATQGQAQAEFSITKPSFSASANVTLPQPSISIDYAVAQPTFTVRATVSGLTITAASDARITLGAASNRIAMDVASNRLTLQAATNRITIN